jgi:glyoxylase-like metal-dependent hydrolase (beta-lactamase superfamily II)
MKRRRVLAASAGLLLMAMAVYSQGRAVSQAGTPIWSPKLSRPAPGELEVLPVQGNITVLMGAGANITVQAGGEGVLLVDSGTTAMTPKVLAAIAAISKRPLRYIINTTDREDHTGGNEKIAPTGEIIPFRDEGYTAGPQGALDTHRAAMISFLSVYDRMVAGRRPDGSLPDDTYTTPQKRLYFNDEPVMIMHMPGNTDGNSVVLFRKSDVVSTGDLFDLTEYPLIDLQAGGSIQNVVDSLNRLIEIVVPRANAEGGTMVIPGHGRISDHADVVYYRDMVVIIRDRLQDMIKQGMTLEQVKAAKPTLDFDARYGNPGGSWTTDKFLEAAYRSLKSGAQAGKETVR